MTCVLSIPTGMQNAAVRSGMGLLGMHPSASLTHPLHQSGLAGQRMPGLLPLDVRPNLLQPGAAGRFPLLMQQGPAQHGAGLLDSTLQVQARARAPFPQLDPFTRTPNLASENLSKTEDESSGADEGKDQDYRFPPMEKQSTGLLRTPPPEHREPLGGAAGGGSGGGIGRPPLLQTPGTQPARTSLVGRLQALAGFTPDNRWNQARGDFDERDGIRGGVQTPVGPKGFQEERPTPGQNFPNRFDSRPGTAGGAAGVSGNAGAAGGPQAWNRSGSTTAPFDSELHQDLDERRRPWDRQRDRDERDFDFRRDMNGNRHSRERERERERDRERERGRDRNREHERDRDRDRDKERDRERERERGGWTPLLPLPTPLLPTPPLNPNLTAGQGKLIAPLKLNPQVQARFQSPLLPQAPTKPSLLGPNQPVPQVQNKCPSPSPSHSVEPTLQSETQDMSATPQAPTPPSAQSPNPSPEAKDKSPVAESPARVESSPLPDSPPQTEVSSPPMAHPSSRTTVSPGSESPGQVSLQETSFQDPTVAFTQAASPPEETSPTMEEQETPQNDEEKQQQASSPEPQWVSRPGMDGSSVAEPTPEPSPESSPEPALELIQDSSSDSLLPLTDPEQQEEEQHLASAKDVDSEQSEPMEDAASQPVVDTVTDTEGT